MTKSAIAYSLILLFGLTVSCSTPLSSEEGSGPLLQAQSVKAEVNALRASGLKATGELWAAWQGCDDENDSGHSEIEIEEDCTGGEGDTPGSSCEDEHGDEGEGHDDGKNCQGARPARDFYLQFDAQLKHERAKGSVIFEGVGEYEGVTFSGVVTWVKEGRAPGELFFGGEVSQGTVSRKCYLFSVRDNGEGSLYEADRMQYRLYGSASSPCHEPDHLPQGYPIAVYEGNLNVH